MHPAHVLAVVLQELASGGAWEALELAAPLEQSEAPLVVALVQGSR